MPGQDFQYLHTVFSPGHVNLKLFIIKNFNIVDSTIIRYIMHSISDERILTLYILAREEYAAAITGDQIEAIEQLKKLSVSGNTDAGRALDLLKKLPDIHPFLKDVLATPFLKSR
jgi:hypothetical protein